MQEAMTMLLKLCHELRIRVYVENIKWHLAGNAKEKLRAQWMCSVRKDNSYKVSYWFYRSVKTAKQERVTWKSQTVFEARTHCTLGARMNQHVRQH